MTLRHIRREPKLGFWAWLFDRKPALRTYCGAPITGEDFDRRPNTPEAHPRLCLSCYMATFTSMLASASRKQRAAEIKRAVDSPN